MIWRDIEDRGSEGLRFMTEQCVRRINKQDRTIEFVASDNSVDSYKTVLPVDKWDLHRFEKNGVVGYMHDIYGGKITGSDVDSVIGKGEAFVEGSQLIIRVTFEPKDLNEKADKIFRKIQFGSLNAVSVGFRPTKEGHWGEKTKGEDPDVYYYDGQELLEVSVVNVPSNPNAIQRGHEIKGKVRKAYNLMSLYASREVDDDGHAPKDSRKLSKLDDAKGKAKQALERQKKVEASLFGTNSLGAAKLDAAKACANNELKKRY